MAPMAANSATTATTHATSLTPQVEDTPLSIPLISLSPLLSSTDSTTKTKTAHALLSAFRTSGFLYLTDYSDLVPPDLIKNAFTQSAFFFALPRQRKESLSWTTPRANRGYTRMGREKTSNGLTSAEVDAQRLGEGEDMKESFEIGREGEPGCPNRWPFDESDDHNDDKGSATAFRETMLEFHARCKEIHRALMRGIALALDLPSTFFDNYTKRGDNTLRLLHYPPVPAGGFDTATKKTKKVRAGAHTDYGSLTLLFQDAAGGLQVDPSGTDAWIDVKPIAGTIVVNAADLLMRWSNDLIRSTRHRVVEPPVLHSNGSGGTGGGGDDGGYPARYSMAYFCNPDFDAWIEAIPGTWEPQEGGKGGKKYGGVNSGEYLEGRLSATY